MRRLKDVALINETLIYMEKCIFEENNKKL